MQNPAPPSGWKGAGGKVRPFERGLGRRSVRLEETEQKELDNALRQKRFYFVGNIFTIGFSGQLFTGNSHHLAHLFY